MSMVREYRIKNNRKGPIYRPIAAVSAVGFDTVVPNVQLSILPMSRRFFD